MADSERIFLSYSRNDLEAANRLRSQLAQVGTVFKDDESIREGDLWLEKLQQAIDACSVFVVLVGRDRVRRWVGAETQVALNRHFGPHNDQQRLPIFPVLLGDTEVEDLPAFLSLFQVSKWDGESELPAQFHKQLRQRAAAVNTEPDFEECPFVGLAAYTASEARLFFGRRQETLDALACFELRRGAADMRWLEINGNSGAGKSSLMNAGILPLVDDGWLWPRTRIEHWQLIGPMMPGERPLDALAECLCHAFGVEMSDVRECLEEGNDHALQDWLRTRKKENRAFLLAIDQFEELFTFADTAERKRFDRLLATALEDPDCPLFVVSTIRADFLDRFETLPALVAVRNRKARSWTLPPISEQGLRELIGGPAGLAGLDVSEVREAMIAEGRDEPGVLPLVEHALEWLWQRRDGNRLRGKLFTDNGGLAGILSRSADDLLSGSAKERRKMLELLFQLVNVDPEGLRHTRRRISLADAVLAAGGGEAGLELIDKLAGQRNRVGAKIPPLRLITVTKESTVGDQTKHSGAATGERWVNLIHETLIRQAPPDASGQAQPYWPALWNYIDKNKHRAQRRERLRLQAHEWHKARGLGRIFGLASWASVGSFRRLAVRGSLEAYYLRWSRAVLALQVLVAVVVLAVIVESVIWLDKNEYSRPVEAVTMHWRHGLGISPPLPELVTVSAGTFMMGSEDGYSDEQPIRAVHVEQPFYLSKTEITFEQYDGFAYYTGRQLPVDEGWGRGTRPVINVHWEDASAYAQWLGEESGSECRLPSEAEWEYAARADTKTPYALPAPGGGDDLSGYANCRDCGSSEQIAPEYQEQIGEQTLPVASFPANAWGLHDMHGNVWEWVTDCWHDSYEGAPDDGRAWLAENDGDCGYRVLRGGGSWYDNQDDARSAYRLRYGPDLRNGFIGFRVLCSSPI